MLVKIVCHSLINYSLINYALTAVGPRGTSEKQSWSPAPSILEAFRSTIPLSLVRRQRTAGKDEEEEEEEELAKGQFNRLTNC